MPTQPEKSTLAAYGTPQGALDELDIDPIVESVTDDHAKRVKSGISGDFRVYPKSDGLYVVESMDGGAVDNTYTVNMKSGSACSCYDYLMRCTGQNLSCKHIWRVRVLIKMDALPGRTQDPFSWLTSQLYKDKEWLDQSDSDLKEYISDINDLQDSLDSEGRGEADYKKHMKERADILMKATTTDL